MQYRRKNVVISARNAKLTRPGHVSHVALGKFSLVPGGIHYIRNDEPAPAAHVTAKSLVQSCWQAWLPLGCRPGTRRFGWTVHTVLHRMTAIFEIGKVRTIFL
ncbi:hypothetical protein Y032_0043g840 [Ancylostoma ceylanicum]|uniref:Uncharacterized protein n=1 Tax=Ancylostoma ceylanicum TaxID=53326 RepID=A0A016UFM2_9BILA|nr:hypothetical protein Y032_0043g840 [Ancylostoma ceylanicum]